MKADIRFYSWTILQLRGFQWVVHDYHSRPIRTDSGLLGVGKCIYILYMYILPELFVY